MNSKKAFIFAYKTTSIYTTEPTVHKSLIANNITTLYKKTSASAKNYINQEAFDITAKLKIDKTLNRRAEQ